MLSPEAKEFVPRGLSSQKLPADASVSPINGLPSYVTTCYPFVSLSEPRTSGRGRGKHNLQQRQQYFPSPQYSPLHTGVPQNRFPHPVKNFGAWNQTSYGNVYPHPASVTNSIPQDGRPCQNGYVHQPLQHPMAGSHYVGSFTVNNTPGEAIGAKEILDNVGLKSSIAQTGFYPNSANVMLEEKPNLVFITSRSKNRWQSSEHVNSQGTSGIVAEVDINLDMCENKVHRQNKISDKTDSLTNVRNEPSLYQDQMTACSYLQDAKSSKEASLSVGSTGMESVNLVPFTDNIAATNMKSSPQMQTYASIAKSKPSQIKQNLVSMTNKSITNISNISNKSRYSRNNMRIDNDFINVAQIMADLEKADTLSISNTLEFSLKMQNSSEANLSDKNLPHAGISSSGYTANGPVHQPSLMKKHKDPNIINQDQIYSFSCDEDQQKQTAYDDNKEQSKNVGVQDGDNVTEIQGERTEVKHKKRRRRRRKKKTGIANQDDNDDANSGTNDDVTLHFEDEEEFPDLSTGQMLHDTSFSLTFAAVSYSDVLKQSNNEVASLKSTQAVPSLQANNIAVLQPSLQSKESRTSKKRRKRREVANKAAEAEMAEISLEQHMLELKMKQKLPLNTKKSVSPVRAAPSQGVWKLNPSPASQPSSSGKKVSLLLPGTVPPEPPVPHQPNSTVKQPGILKMPSVSVAVNKGAISGKKSKQPISYDLAALIGDALESKKDQVHSKKETKPVAIKKEDLKPHNSLDASAPLLKRGKERETPKIKKPSPLKKVILKEREEKKRLRLLDDDDDDGTTGAPVGIGVVSGGESDLSQDTSFRSSMEVGLGTPASAELSPISQPSPSCMSPMSSGTSPMNSGVNSPVTGTHVIQQTVKLKIHSRRFREYCNQLLDKEVDNHVTALLTDLVRFQDKQYHKDPVKAKAKRRFVLGLREVTKHLKLRKVKCVIISPNLEKIQSKGGLDDALNTILELCNEQKVPFIFSLGRRALGRACAKLVPVSVVGIFNFEGSEDNFRSVVALTEKAREQYREMISQIEKEIAEQPPRSITPGVPHIFAHYGHSRTPSGCSVISFTSSILSEPISENYPQSEPETDNRGYEIEDKVDTEVCNDNKISGKQHELEADPYEADDESGFNTNKKSPRSQQKDRCNNSIKNSEESIQLLEGKESNAEMVSERTVNTEVIVAQLKDIVPGDLSQELSDGVDSAADDDDDDDDDDSKGEISNAVNTDIEDIIQEDSDDLHFDTCNDDDHLNEGADKVHELPNRYNSSVHCFEHTEVLSQHSQHSNKTIDNCEEVMSTHSSKTTHSSRTLGDGSNKAGERCAKTLNEVKNIEHAALIVKNKVGLEKEHRTLSWVKEAQMRHTIERKEKLEDSDEHGVDVCEDAINVEV